MSQVVRLMRAAILLAAALAPSAVLSQSAPLEAPRASEQVTILDVQVGLSEVGPVVLLRAEGRAIPILVDATVANSIQGALSGDKTERPLSHDLMREVLQAFGGRVTRTEITLKGTTFVAALTVSFDKQVKVFDSRSSDSIALAIHFKAPIIVGRDLLENYGRLLVQPGSLSM